MTQTTKDFMESQGFTWENASGFGTYDGFWRGREFILPSQAALMHRLFIQGQIETLENLPVSGFVDGNGKRQEFVKQEALNKSIATLTKELEELDKEEI